MTRAARRALPALALAAGVLGGLAWAQDRAEILRPCRRTDLLGVWEVIRLGAAPSFPVDRRDPAYYPFQRYVFHANATVHHLTSRTKITPVEQRALLEAPATISWAIDGPGRLLLHRDGASRLEFGACEVLLKELGDSERATALPGDLLITHHDENDRPVLRRQLRRLQGAGGAQ